MAPSLRDLHGRLEVAREVLGNTDDTGPQLAAQAHTKLDGGPVRPNRDLLAVPDPACARVLFRQLRLGLRPLEVQLAHAFDSRAGEQRPVANEAQTAVSR